MFKYLEEKTTAEQESIRKAIQELLMQTCVLKVKCDPVTLEVRDNPSYQVLNRHREFLSDYLAVLGCELLHEPQAQIFYLAGEAMPVEHINLFTTKLVLLLKLIYRDKIMGNGLNATITTLSEIREYGRNADLLTKKVPVQEWQEALSVLKRHQMIEIPGAVRNVEDRTPVYINPTINLYLKAADIVRLLEKFQTEEMETTQEEEA